MANYRPKSLSELNTVYDKAMRAEKAIKEGSNLLSTPEAEATPPSENIFTQLETAASEAEKNQVFDPDITNIANDFLKRYAKPEKPKATPKEVKRPAPSIQSVYHAPTRVRQEEKADVPMSTGNDFASGFETPAVPLHKPAPTMPAVQPPVVREPETVREAPAPQIITAPEAPATPVVPAASTPAVAPAPKAETPSEVPAPAVKTAPQPPVRKASPRVRITSTERSELMEEYMRVMYDEDDDDDYSYKKPKFSFFKKKKKHEEAIEEEPELLYEESYEDEDEDTTEEEVPVVPFDNSDVRYTDEYSDAPAEDISEDEMDVYDYIEADFDYDESEEDDDVLDISLAPSTQEESEAVEETAKEEEIQPEAEEIEEEQVEIPAEEVVEEIEEAEVVAEATESTDEAEETAEATYETEDNEEVVVYPEESAEEEAEEVIYPDAPPADMVFEDIFSVSDESKRSHTGGNWEEVFGKNFNADKAEEAEEEIAPVTYETEDGDYEEAPVEEYPYYEEYPEEETQDEEIKQPKKQIILKVLMLLVAFVCITGAAATVFITSLTAVNTGKIVSDRYRTFSVSENIESLGLSAGDFVITENVYAHTDDRYVYSENGTYAFGIVTDSTTNESGDYIYETQTEDDIVLVNRNNSMGVIVATYSGVGTILAIICDYYIFIAGALLILAVAMIVCFILISKRKSSTEESPEYDEDDDIDDSDADNDYEDPAETTEYDDDDDTDNYYDYDTDGIEEGLFSDI